MVYRGERMYPARAARAGVRAKKKRGRLIKISAVFVVVSLLMASLIISYSRLQASRQQVMLSRSTNTRLAENVELYNAEIARMTAPEIISERAREMGLVDQKSGISIKVPGRG